MKKVLTNREIQNIIGALNNESMAEFISKKLPISFAWNLKKNVTTLLSLSKTIDESLNEIRSQYADDEHSHEITNENGDVVRVPNEEYFNEYVGKINELLDQENEVDINTCSIDVLNNIGTISMIELNAIDFMIEE